MNMLKPLVYAGVINYNEGSLKYSSFCMASLRNGGYDNLKIVVADNSDIEDNGNKRFIAEKFPEAEFYWMGGNLGFGAAYNFMFKKAISAGAKYFFMLNNDAIVEPGAIEQMVDAMEKDEMIGAVAPKILKWDFANNNKTDIIDSCGIKLKPGLRFVDIGQGEIDSDKYSRNLDILGPSGAAGLFRLEALEKIKEDGNYYDELMFMYKEDCDLAYRLYLAGYKSKCIAGAIAYHDRTVSGKGEGNIAIALNRRNNTRQAKRWSFLHQQIIIKKFWRRQSFINKLAILYYQFIMVSFCLLFEQYLLKEFLTLGRIKDRIVKY